MISIESAGPSSSRRSSHFKGKVLQSWDKAILPFVFVVMLVVFYAIDQRTLSPGNLMNVLNQVSILAIVTVGASVVIFSGGFDLSAGAVVALSAVLAALVVDITGDVWLGVSAGIFIGLVVGGLNGFFVGYLNVSPLIVTLGALNICRGLALVLAKDGAIYSFPSWYTNFGAMRFLGIPSLAWVAIVLFVIVSLILRYTPFGLNLYASGGNPKAARLSGVPVARVKLIAFAISGACCGVAGVLLTVRSGGGDPTSGMLYELEAIAAVVLGGAALSGGEGRLWRSMLAILLLAVLANGLNIIGVHPHWKGVVIGVILTIAATLDALKRSR
ncbi:ribose ABC transporter permease [Pusillimonas sp. T2]|nr:ribose ABC transporter permease [Pusillimonas sp. T2]